MVRKKYKETEDLYLIWEYFNKIQLTKNSVVKCVCKFCNRVYISHKKRLLNHLTKMCKKCPANIKTYVKHIEKKMAKTKEEQEAKGNSAKKSRQSDENDDNAEEFPAVDELGTNKKSTPKCFVYGCNRTRAEFSFFSAPRDPVKRELWNSIIAHPFQQRNLKATDLICERHFAPRDVIRYLVVNDVRIPNKYPVLRRGCLPIKFFDKYVLKSYNQHITKLFGKCKRRKTDGEEKGHGTNANKARLTDLDVIEELAINPEFEIVIENDKSVEAAKEDVRADSRHRENEEIVKSEPDDDIGQETVIGDDSQDNFDVPEENLDIEYNVDAIIKSEPCDIKDEIDYDSDSSGDEEDIDSHFFERIFETKSFPGLSEHWAIYPCKNDVKPLLQNLVSEDRSVVFVQMKVRNGLPIMEKQVVLTEDLKLRYYTGHHNIPSGTDLPKDIANIAELADAINKYSSLSVCEGGPGLEEFQEMVYTSKSSYHIDHSSQTWRHNKCTLFAAVGKCCKDCKNVKKYFKRISKVNDDVNSDKNNVKEEEAQVENGTGLKEAAEGGEEKVLDD